MSHSVVIVESPAKAKTINKYLGKDYTVLASYGHVRDLVPKEGAVDPEHDFEMKYQLIERNAKQAKPFYVANWPMMSSFLPSPKKVSAARSLLQDAFYADLYEVWEESGIEKDADYPSLDRKELSKR